MHVSVVMKCVIDVGRDLLDYCLLINSIIWEVERWGRGRGGETSGIHRMA